MAGGPRLEMGLSQATRSRGARVIFHGAASRFAHRPKPATTPASRLSSRASRRRPRVGVRRSGSPPGGPDPRLAPTPIAAASGGGRTSATSPSRSQMTMDSVPAASLQAGPRRRRSASIARRNALRPPDRAGCGSGPAQSGRVRPLSRRSRPPLGTQHQWENARFTDAARGHAVVAHSSRLLVDLRARGSLIDENGAATNLVADPLVRLHQRPLHQRRLLTDSMSSASNRPLRSH